MEKSINEQNEGTSKRSLHQIVDQKSDIQKNPDEIKTDCNVNTAEERSPKIQKKRQMTLPLENTTINNNASTTKQYTRNTTPPTITTSEAEDLSNLSDCLKLRKSFKTKRFYESEDDSLSMIQLFSETIRSTSATPTDECEISDVVGIVQLDNVSAGSTSSLPSTKSAISSINYFAYEMPNVSSISPTLKCNPQQVEYSSTESQTDTIEMYNEPSLRSLINNVADDENTPISYITDPDILPSDRSPITTNTHNHASKSRSAIRSTPSIVLECYNDEFEKTEEYELERAHNHNSPPFFKPIPRRPLEGVNFFDTTIEEEGYYDADVESEEGGGAIAVVRYAWSKGTNTVIPFDCSNIPPIRDAAKFPNTTVVDNASGSIVDGGEDDNTESIKTDILEDDQLESEITDTFVTAQSEGDLSNSGQQDEITEWLDALTHASTSTQHNAESEYKTTISSKKITSKTTRTSSTLTTFDSIDNSAESISALAIDSSKSATKKKSATLTGKKKSKKSKKSDPEKENISVKKIYLMAQPPLNWRPIEQPNRTVSISRAVSVKHLCRSFGDLREIDNMCDDTNLKRAKSVGDVRRSLVRAVQTGVSVKLLRDSYCNIVGLGSSNSPNMKKKSSFSKFDALQKKNILRVRSSDAGKAQEKFSDGNVEIGRNCYACEKIVYKMEEIKAEKNIWHRNCFRCTECCKQLSVDAYQSHGSVLYCKPHFKQLFAPKVVEDNEPIKPKKLELIIRENQPVELPPDVARSSDKPGLGLEELQQLNVKSRFQVFENYQERNEQNVASIERSPSGVKRSASILSKLAKFQAKGMNTGVSDDALNDVPYEQSSSEDDDDGDEDIADGEDVNLIRAKRAQRERPMSFGNMNDIKTKFEKGHSMTKEERREECKQEIQNIRSRLFMGKQARIKEMYQQAVADSEQGITSTSKKPEIDIGDKAKMLRDKFEKGEIFKNDDEEDGQKSQDDEMAVFEQGIGKQSRSIFMELDASASKSPQILTPMPSTPRTPDTKKHAQVSPLQMEKLKPFTGENVVKCDEKADDIKIETSEISSKFKFFETFKPDECRRKEFRITPPREGVVKMPSPDREIYMDPDVVRSEEMTDNPGVAEQSHTTTKMLSVFRQMEQSKLHDQNEAGLKPLKCFTPPPDKNRRVFSNESEEEEYSGSEEDEEEEEEMGEEEESEPENQAVARYDDELLKQAQTAARAKQLRAKFEKWEANEIQREMSNGNINIYDQVENSEDGQIETAKSLRAKFESMKESTAKTTTRPRVQVNRFV